MTKEKKKPNYRIGYKYLLNHIEELEKRLDQKEDLIERIFQSWINDSGEDEKTATREAYKIIYYDKWKNFIPGEYLTKKESCEWFDDNHDDWFCSGPYSDFRLEAQHETGIYPQFINGKIVKDYNHPQLKY